MYKHRWYNLRTVGYTIYGTSGGAGGHPTASAGSRSGSAHVLCKKKDVGVETDAVYVYYKNYKEAYEASIEEFQKSKDYIMQLEVDMKLALGEAEKYKKISR